MDIVAIFLTLAVLILVGAYLYAPFLRGYGKRVTEEERARLSKRNFYRVLKQFASRRDLLVGAAGDRTRL